MSLRDDVKEFHLAMKQPVLETPTIPSQQRLRLRAQLIGEEFVELLDAMGFDSYSVAKVKLAIMHLNHFPFSAPPDLVAVADACADLQYVIVGTELEFGIDGEPVAKAVHISNMRKTGGKVREDGKIQKPDGWRPPDIAGCLRAQGWEP